jgi:pimeloyl-ACP methyl ester carboxylesterase
MAYSLSTQSNLVFTIAEREALKASYPGAKVHTFASGGHQSGFTHREEFNQVLEGFLDKTE